MAFTHDEQVEIVRKAFALETAIKVENANVELIRSQVFDRFPTYADVFPGTPPIKPQRIIYQRPAPLEPVIPEPPKAKYPFWKHLVQRPYWLVIIVGLFVIALVDTMMYDAPAFVDKFGNFCMFAFPPAVVASLISWSFAKGKKNEKLAQSPEYMRAVNAAEQYAAAQQAQVDLLSDQEQAKLDAEFAAATDRYNSVLLPAYQKQTAANQNEYEQMRVEYEQDKAEWEAKRAEAIALLEADISANEAALAELYDSTGIISLHYREIPILEWLYDDMRSSDHDIRYATELLDRDRQRIATEEAGARVTSAVDRLQEQIHEDATGIMQLQDVQIRGLQNLEAISSDILYTTEDIYTSSKKILFHQRVNTVDIAVREWRRHKELKA